MDIPKGVPDAEGAKSANKQSFMEVFYDEILPDSSGSMKRRDL